ncbi:MAG: hypothetical protein IPQ13_03290 [Holophagaceae bacterium]|nr:hypothetical protein [Holophagaceae bacterium]
MKRAACLLALSAAELFGGWKIGKLPDWAQAYALAATTEKPPEDADAWVLLDRTEFAYVGNGEIRRRHFRLVQVLGEKATGEGVYSRHGLGGSSSRIKKLRGWNLRPDDTVTRVDRDDLVLFDSDSGGKVSTTHVSMAALEGVVKGSFVAFESQEMERMPMGAVAYAMPMETHPVRRWEVEFAKEGGWFSGVTTPKELRVTGYHFAPWLQEPVFKAYQSIRLENVPAIPKHESALPNWHNVLPRVEVVCVDDAEGLPDLNNWEGFARWVASKYKAKNKATAIPGVAGMGLDGLRAASRWMSRELTYKQVYLTPDRGWIPEESGEVVRKRYGDCKDLTSCLSGAASQLGFKAYPVLARIMEGRIEESEALNPYLFNHVISAIRLDKSLGLPAEVETTKGRFLLVDPTSRLTQLGWLPPAHRRGRVLICTEDGAAWAQIPDLAVEPSSMTQRLEASVDASGRMTGTLTFREVGDAWGLRSAGLHGTRKDLEKFLLNLLDLPSNAKTVLGPLGDPLDLGRPLEVQLSLDVPEVLLREGGDLVLRNICLPNTPEPIQKLGIPRQFPVHLDASSSRTFEAVLTFANPLAPVSPEQVLETPFRKTTWKARQEGNKVHMAFHQERPSVDFPFSQREEGVKQQRKDRSALKRFVDDALSFKPAI